MLLLAEKLAITAHAGQLDKAGVEYWRHPMRVAFMVSGDQERQVAWLHDVLEDTTYTADDLVRYGFSDDVIEAVELLTKHKGTRLDDYYARIRENDLARTVKLADVADNLNPERLALLDTPTQHRLRAKYIRSLLSLGALDVPAVVLDALDRGGVCDLSVI